MPPWLGDQLNWGVIRKHQRPATKPAAAHKAARADKPEMTLDRVLSRAGVASRTVAAGLITAGRVTIDGRTCRDPQTWVTPERQQVALDGHALQRPQPLYLALHKPVGFITSHGDPDGRKTIYDLLGDQAPWVFPVGRLDRDTSGLLLLTNDSLFAERIANPELHVGKVYRVKVQPPLRESQLERLRQGLEIGREERTAPATVTWLRANERYCWIELEIHEGKNRQIRRMIAALGHEVMQLVRIRIGRLELGSLPPGAVRRVRPAEVV